MPDLTILCISAREPHSEPFRDELAWLADLVDAEFVDFDGRGAGILEYVLDEAVEECPDGHILLIDDDERCSNAMVRWLAAGAWKAADNWAFPRAHLWGNERQVIKDSPLWPDLQTRLATKAKSGGRTRVHQGSPHGTGRVAPVAIEHHKFLVRTHEERQRILDSYVALWPQSANPHYRAFSIPGPITDLQPWDSSVPVEAWEPIAA